MAVEDFKIYTEQETEALALVYLQQLYPGKATHPRSFLGGQAKELAQVVGALQVAIQDAYRDGIPATTVVEGILQSQCSSARLDEWAQVFGLETNRGVGLYGRNGAVSARGGVAFVTGRPGTVVAAGALLSDLAGQVQIELTAGVVIPGGGSIAGSFQASTPGATGNLAIGSVLRWLAPPAGLAPTVTLSTALTGGYEVESDLDLVLRLLRLLRSPPEGGTAADFRRWAESSVDISTLKSLGITRAYVYPHRDGIGSVDVLVTTSGSGKSRDPDLADPGRAGRVLAYLQTRRVVCDTVRVLRPQFDADGLRVRIRGVPAARFTFDWTEDGAGLGLGLAITGATNTSVTVATASVPARLLSALIAGQPRVQLLLPSVTPLPVQRRIVQVATNAGNTTFILDAQLPAVPQVGDRLLPGGGAVDPVALSVLAYIDQVGPSQQSGFWDNVTDEWEAKVTVGKLATAALTAVSADGSRVLVYSSQVGQGVGVQIAVGALGVFGSGDYELFDNVPAGGSPQLPFALSIQVVPGLP